MCTLFCDKRLSIRPVALLNVISPSWGFAPVWETARCRSYMTVIAYTIAYRLHFILCQSVEYSPHGAFKRDFPFLRLRTCVRHLQDVMATWLYSVYNSLSCALYILWQLVEYSPNGTFKRNFSFLRLRTCVKLDGEKLVSSRPNWDANYWSMTSNGQWRRNDDKLAIAAQEYKVRVMWSEVRVIRAIIDVCATRNRARAETTYYI